MEVAGLALSAAQTLLAALGCSQLQHIFSRWGYQSELDSLHRTVSCVQAVLLDAQSKDHLKLTHFERDTIQKLKDALYEADDLLDEFATLARQHQIDGDKFLGKVRRLFPRFKNLKTVSKLSKEVKNIRNMLDQTTKEAAMFGFKVKLDPQHNRVFSRDETHSYANENDIVGRDEDKRKIVDMLLDPNLQDDVFVLTIVGVGGLGKTALAQLVYNHPRIQAEFHSKIWVCVSDQDQNKPDQGKMVLAKILGTDHNETYDSIVQKLRMRLGEGKYMIVLDDVWTEDPCRSQEWFVVLKGCARRGSRIVVTTRSKGTATAVRSNHVYELQGLSNEYSWSLFEMMVGKEKANRPDLIHMGKDIIKKCANVPLAINVLGSLLRDQDRNKWQLFRQSKLNEIGGNSNNHIMKILKFSYYHLSLELKTCFAYCAIFPKDFEIEKQKLLWQWMAQGYVKPLNGGQVVEEAAEDYFQILVQRCFFHDIQNKYEGNITFKIHDLMHDIAQEVVGSEIIAGDSDPSGLGKTVRHFFDDNPRSRRDDSFVIRTTIRSYVQHHNGIFVKFQFPVSSLVANWRCLRLLDLSHLGIHSLPNEVGELLHLRYIDLSSNGELEVLPESFGKLINLEILILDECYNLKELPKDFKKLVNLRTLQVKCKVKDFWRGLNHMPLGMEKLTSLSHLNLFVVANRESRQGHNVGGLRELRSLINLRDSLEIRILPDYKHVKEDSGEGYLSSKSYLNDICIKFVESSVRDVRESSETDVGESFKTNVGESSGRDEYSDETLLEDLMPHPNLEVLRIKGYKGVKIPSWRRQDNLAISLPNLVNVSFECMPKLQELSYLSQLPFLKVLMVRGLPNLMYMENRTIGDGSRSSCAAPTEGIQEFSSSLCFPSLEDLELEWLPKLEGWWNMMSICMPGSESRMGNVEKANGSSSMQANRNHRVPSFPHLSRLHIRECPRLTYIPLCPCVEKIALWKCNERLKVMDEEENQSEAGCSNDSGNLSHGSKLRYLETDNLRHLRFLPGRTLQKLEKIQVEEDEHVESLAEVGESLKSCSSSLQALQISYCNNLRSVSGGLEYLTMLESLSLYKCDRYRIEEDYMQWRCLGHCLRSLGIYLDQRVKMPKEMANLTSLQSLVINELEEIPEWIGCLSSLQSLHIDNCKSIKSVPKGMRKLTSLTRVTLYCCCGELIARCQQPNGEDWPNIQHIPTIFLDDASMRERLDQMVREVEEMISMIR